MEYVERNYHLVQERMIEQMEDSLKLGRRLIDTELDAGWFNFVIKPIVKTFYDYWTQHEAKVGTLKQIKIALESGKELVLNGNSEEGLNKIVEKNFPKFLKYDQTTYQCDKNHKNYSQLEQITRETFINYVEKVVAFLQVEDKVNDYGDLCRRAFKNKEYAKENLMKQLDHTDESITLIEKDPSILSVPVGKRIIIKALRKGFEETKKEFIKAINETYD
ncbi:MAG: hypothetical protein P8Y23_09285 [Candidatus Lokiarchaeota archaeon]|jgi:hypothetical protein